MNDESKLFVKVKENQFKLIYEMTEEEYDDFLENAYSEGANARLEGISQKENPYFKSNYSPKIKKDLIDSWDGGWQCSDGMC